MVPACLNRPDDDRQPIKTSFATVSLWRPRAWSLAAAVLAFLCLRLWLCSHLGLTEDEAYYRLWSLAPSLSFLDHPPMVSLLIASGRSLAGDTELGVRLLAPLLLAASIPIFYRTAKLLTDVDTAVLATLLLLAVPLLNIGGVIITPDLPSVFFFGLVVWALAELDHSQNPAWWLAIGIFAGCGLLSKYTNLFAGATILLWLIAVPQNRKWLSYPQLWLGGAIALALFSPVVMWNAAHDWASFHKQLGRVADGHTIGVVHLLEFGGALLALFSPVLAALSIAGLNVLLRQAVEARDSRAVLILAAILPLLTYFTVHSLHDRVQGNWLAPVFPMLALCAAIGVLNMPVRLRLAATLSALITGLGMTGVIYAHALAPIADLRKDPTGQMRGLDAFQKQLSMLAQDHGAMWISTSSYGTTGQLAYLMRTHLPVTQLTERVRYEHLPLLQDNIKDQPSLYVELERRSREPLLRKCFSEATRIATLTRADGSKNGTNYAVYSVKGLRSDCGTSLEPLRAAPVR